MMKQKTGLLLAILGSSFLLMLGSCSLFDPDASSGSKGGGKGKGKSNEISVQTGDDIQVVRSAPPKTGKKGK